MSAGPQPPPHLTSRRQRKLWEQQQLENAAKRQKKDGYENKTPFRHAERYYKQIPTPDLSEVVDFDRPEAEAFKDRIVHVSLSHKLPLSLFGKETSEAYVLKDCSGLIVIPNPFSPDRQRYFIKQCLSRYALPPNRSNLDPHYRIPASGLWKSYWDEKYHGKIERIPKVGSSSEADDKDSVLPSDIFHRLRWITLGYQYDWTTKEYRPGEQYMIEDDLCQLTKAIVAAVEDVGIEDWKNTYKSDRFKSEAGVINYYQLKDTLMGHVDQSERNMAAPLVSVSFGHSCIYLLGGETRETPPLPILLKSGDVLIMTGACRKAYHGVPRILEGSLPSYLSADVSDPNWDLYGQYMSTSRINLNVRQVEL
ncbi:hypothetical protein BX666DRAFT_595466 [Dichotomocladium elegans]|nr:hypothetical protein BX666DRAFT_595466 [Dichotomocladium elegans]